MDGSRSNASHDLAAAIIQFFDDWIVRRSFVIAPAASGRKSSADDDIATGYATCAGGAVPASASGSASQMTRLRPLRLAV